MSGVKGSRWGLVLVFAGFASCTRGCDSKLAASIGPEGGQLASKVGAVSVRLEVPPGALTTVVPLSLRLEEARLPEAVGPTLELLPHGTQFAVPVSVAFEVGDDVLARAHGLPIYVATRLDSGEWELLPTKPEGPRTLVGKTTHFSTFSLVAPCLVAGTGTDFAVTGCPSFNPAFTSNVPVEATMTVGQVSLMLELRAASPSTSVDLIFTGLRPNWTYYAVTTASPNSSPVPSDPNGRLVLSQALDRETSVLLMENHGSEVLTPSTCASMGIWNPATRECALTRDIPDAPLYIPEDAITLNCQDPVTGVQHVVGSGTRAGVGITAYWTSYATANAVIVKNCIIRNADFGLSGVLPGFRAEGVSIFNDPGTPALGVGLLLGAQDAGIGSSAENISIANVGVGLASSHGRNITLRGLRIQAASAALAVSGDVTVEDGELRGMPETLDGGLQPNGLITIYDVGTPTLRRMTTSGTSGHYAALYASVPVSIDGLSASGGHIGVAFNGQGQSILTNSTLTGFGIGLNVAAGAPLVFHNNISSNQLNVRSDIPIELSDSRSTSPTFNQGNFWGHSCPAALFVAGVDSNGASVVDSHPFAQLGGWGSGESPGCATPPDVVAPPAPILNFPASGASLIDSTVSIAGSTEAGATVAIAEGATLLGVVTADTTGTFSIALGFADGSHSIVASATDAAGNRSMDSAPLSFSVASISDATPSVDGMGVLRVTSVRDALDPFVPSSGELNTVFLEGEMVQAAGAAGNHAWQANVRREISDPLSGAVVAVRDASTLIAKSTDPTRPGFRFNLSSAWDGRDDTGALRRAGPYVSKLTVWIIRDPVGLPTPPVSPSSGLPPSGVCGPAAQPVSGPCKVHQLPVLELTSTLLDVPPPALPPVVPPTFRQEYCNGIDDNDDGRIDEGACVPTGCSGCIPISSCGPRRCVSVPDGCGGMLTCPCP